MSQMFNTTLRKQAVEKLNDAISRYDYLAARLEMSSAELYDLRYGSLYKIRRASKRINELANTPKKYQVEIKKIEFETEKFHEKEEIIKKAEIEAKRASGGIGAGATLSALGVAVAGLGPTAAMGIATTFGVASTGTGISSLSGAAATNAALAWLGGGAVSVGGGGMSAGSLLLGLAGPVGMGIAAVSLTVSVGSGFFANKKNKEVAQEAWDQRLKIEEVIRKFKLLISEVEALMEITREQTSGIKKSRELITGDDYQAFSDDEKMQAAMLVNGVLTLAQLLNKEIEIGGY